MRSSDRRWRVALLGLPGLLVACMPAQPNRGLEQELQAARSEAALEQRRVHELEARLAHLEIRALQTPAAASAGTGDPTIQRQLNLLIALNQELLREAQANRERVPVAPAALAPVALTPATLTPAALTPATPPQRTVPASGVSPECNAGLTTEQKILELVLALKGERSPWRADGLSYEESQALRVLLRADRPLDRDNPWQ
ncbi:MAG TPA: hypothetical protein VI197_14655 [Polyangiaceae bacterium]